MSATSTVSNAFVDLRFDYSSNIVDTNGYQINSASEIDPLLQHLKVLGFNTVTFDVDVPINMTNGSIDLGDLANGTNKALPADIWKEVAYAKSLGLAVNIQALPCVIYNSDGTFNNTDAGFSVGTPLAAGVSLATVFGNIATYEASIAKLAQQNGADGFYIGANDYGYDQSQYLTYWQQIVSSVRAVFSGKITYQASYDNAVFGLVDYISYQINPVISSSPIYDLAQIIEGYFHTPNTTSPGNVNFVQSILNLDQEYNQPIILDQFSANSVNTGIGNVISPWSLLIGANPQDLKSLPSPNFPEQALAYQAFLYVAYHILGNAVAGAGVGEYDPWAQSADLQNPQPNSNSVLWNLWNLDSADLWNQPTTEAAIQKALASNVLPNYFFSTSSNDTLNGNTGSTNTVVFYATTVSSNIVINQSTVTVTSQADGTDVLTNFQILKFADQAIQTKWFTEAASFTHTNPSGFTTLTEMYLAYFNRAPDAVGLDYWASASYEGQTNSQIAGIFSTTPEAISTFGTIIAQSSTAAITNFVNDVYQNVLNRAPDAGGLTYWVSQLQSGSITPGNYILSIIDAVNGQTGTADKLYLTSKETVGAHFAITDGLTDTIQAANVMKTFNTTYLASGATASIVAANALSDGYLSHVTTTPELVVQLVGISA